MNHHSNSMSSMSLRDMFDEPMALGSMAEVLAAFASTARRLDQLRNRIDNAPEHDGAALAPLFLNMLDAARR